MPSALYLYNSRDFAAIDFFQKLKLVFADANWQLRADFNEGLEGTVGSSFDRLSTLVRDVEVIIYAIGPLGTGKVQGNYEIGQILQVQQQNNALKIVPVLVGSATANQIPQSLQHLTAQMDNSTRGGADALGAVFKTVIGSEMPKILKEQQKIHFTSDADLQEFFQVVTRRARRRGLTLFIGPYAAADVHGTIGPSEFGHSLLQRTTNPAFTIEPDDLLAHPWVASTACRLVQPESGGFPEVWETILSILKETSSDRLPLDDRIATLARAWVKLGAAPEKGKVLWSGLLLVTAEHGMRLEEALWAQRLQFGRVRCSANGVVFYERPEALDEELHFKEILKLDSHIVAKGTEAGSFKLDLEEKILVLKLMDCVTAADPPPLSTGQQLKVVRDRPDLPNPIPQHLQWAPFVMLGGGLLNPIVSQVFTNYFLPNFEQKGQHRSSEVDDDVPRHIVFHPSPGRMDSIRRFEQQVDTTRPRWPREVFKLNRLDWPLPEFISRLAYQLVELYRAEGKL